MNPKAKIITWIFQIAAGTIFLWVGLLKINSNPTDIFLFSKLEMEPFGRYLIGALEIIAGILLFTHTFSAAAAFLGIGIMCGAIIAHTTVLGASIHGDQGIHIILLITVLISCGTVFYLRRKQLPFIGKTL